MKVLKYSGMTICLLLIILSGYLRGGQPRPFATLPEESAKQLRNARESFAVRWFQTAVREQSDKNVVVSPLGTQLMLDTILPGSNGNTKDELEQVCFAPVFQKPFEPLFESHWFQYAAENYRILADSDELKITAGAWIQEDYQLKTTYTESISQLMKQEITSLDFTQKGAEKEINAWIEKKSDGKIRDLLGPLSDRTRLLLANTLVFNGKWKHAFDANNTRKGYFTSFSGEEIRIPMMQQQNTFRYFKWKHCQMLEMAYDKDRFSMVVFLPESWEAWSGFVKDFSAEKLTQWRRQAKNTLVDVRFPVFTLENNLNLIPSMQTMGAGEAFSDKADFSRLADGKDLKISQMTQGVFVKVDESGTEAAAATTAAFGVKSLGVKNNPTFYADRPFMFIITEKATDSILFMGQIVDPAGLVKTNLARSETIKVTIESTAPENTDKIPVQMKIDKRTHTQINTVGVGGILE